MFVAGFAALVVAQAGSANAPLRIPAALNCIAMPMLMSAQPDATARRAVPVRGDRRANRPTPRCFRLSAR